LLIFKTLSKLKNQKTFKQKFEFKNQVVPNRNFNLKTNRPNRNFIKRFRMNIREQAKAAKD
jgi:hypothetical protein